MAIPIRYNIRNLRLRKGLTIMTALGIALTVTTAIFLMALIAGLNRAFVSSGSAKKDRKSTRLNSSHRALSRMPSSA